MTLRWLSMVVALALPLAARAEPKAKPKLTPVTAAPAWVKLITTTDKVPAATTEAPLDYVIEAPAKACKGLQAGKATTTAQAAKLKACLVAQLEAIGVAPATATPQAPSIVALEDVIAQFPKKTHKAMRAASKGTTAVDVRFIGEGMTLSITLAFTADFHVRAMWVEYGEFE